jgi:hypothetical protein
MPRATAAKKKPSNAKFDYGLDFTKVNMRKSPHLYRIGLGEQGVLSVEPYKSELLPLWRFKTPDIARESSHLLKEAFDRYKEEGDFIGMDMARKFIQMGVTRARRYANWPGGKKYAGTLDAKGKRETVVKGPEDSVKAESARIFGVVLAQVKQDPLYVQLAEEHRERHERQVAGASVMSGKEKEALGKHSKKAIKDETVDARRPQVSSKVEDCQDEMQNVTERCGPRTRSKQRIKSEDD